MGLYLYAWNKASEGAKELSEALGIKRLKHEGSRFRGNPRHTVINWGSGNIPQHINGSVILNSPDAVIRCSNKLSFFRHVSKHEDINLPPWTEKFEEAMEWVKKGDVMARTVLNGHSAVGLIIMKVDNPDTFIKAPLYTKYIPKKDEYRVHVFKDKVIDVQRKALKPEFLEANRGNINHQVRNLDNGFIYVRGGINPPQQVLDQAINSVKVVGLDFGAVDIIYNEKQQKAYVLEINSAPGLQGQTVTSYANEFRKYK